MEYNLIIKERIQEQLAGSRKITFLVGAGLSSESGVPTFRDKDGYWTEGSENYTPQEMGTLRMFNVNAHKVWNWYLNRIQVGLAAKPNNGHYALTSFQKKLKERFALISQNVDGLHFQTGMDERQLYLIHGDLRYMRCSDNCSNELFEIPDQLLQRGIKNNLDFEESLLLDCPHCNALFRPHVLWFDEYYNERFYKLQTVQRIAKETGLLFIVGTSGATNLPKHIVEKVLSKSGVVIDINPNENQFTKKISQAKNAYWLQGKSGEILPFLFKEFYE